MWTDQIVQSPETLAQRDSMESAPPTMNSPCTGPQDIDLLAAESEAMEAAGVPWEWRDALRKTVTAAPEEGAPCPGGFGV